MNILQCYYLWLPLTMSWLYNQLAYLPEEIRSEIYCDQRDDRYGYAMDSMHVLYDQNRLYAHLNFLLRKTGWGYFSGHLHRVLRNTTPDVIHAHFGNMGWEVMPAARAHGIPMITTFYGQDVNYLPVQRPSWYRRYPDLFSYNSMVLCEGPFMKQQVVELGCPAERVLVHHLGVETDMLPFKVRKPGDSPVRFLIAGAFREKKGISCALEALRRLAGTVDFEVTLIGDSAGDKRNRTETAKIHELLASPELSGRARHLGFQPHKRLIQEALDHHIFLSPSVTAEDGDTEGGAPVALTEMTATGMPVISTDHCDIPNIIRHQINGLLAPERDINRLTELITHLVDQPELWETYGRNGRAIVEKEFNATLQGRRLGGVYPAVLHGDALPEDQGISSEK